MIYALLVKSCVTMSEKGFPVRVLRPNIFLIAASTMIFKGRK